MELKYILIAAIVFVVFSDQITPIFKWLLGLAGRKSTPVLDVADKAADEARRRFEDWLKSSADELQPIGPQERTASTGVSASISSRVDAIEKTLVEWQYPATPEQIGPDLVASLVEQGSFDAAVSGVELMRQIAREKA